MAMAGKWMADYFNRPEFTMFDYDTYALCGDGCMMEGVSSEAASLAGHLKLSNLCWIYDNNKISIEGHTDWAFSDDVATRFIGYGWNVTRVGDANDLDMLDRAFKTFKNVRDRPTLIIVDSHIAYGSPNKQDTSAAHGAPLGEDEIRLTKKTYGWPEDAKFLVPEAVRESFQQQIAQRGRSLREAWMERFEEYRKAHPTLADHLYKMQHRELPEELPVRSAELSGGPERRIRQGRIGPSDQRGGSKHPLARRRLGRFGSLNQDPAHVLWSRRFYGGHPREAATFISAYANTPWPRS